MEDVGAGAVTVLVNPTEIEFLAGEQDRRVVTIYNPYTYPITYKILCNATSQYCVADATGGIMPLGVKDVVIRCTSRMHAGTVGKLRIDIRRKGETEIHGSRELIMRTVAERSSSPRRKPADTKYHRGSSLMTDSNIERRHQNANERSVIWMLSILFIICSITLLLPTAYPPEEESTRIPNYLHPTVPQKLAAAFTIGCLAMYFLRPN